MDSKYSNGFNGAINDDKTEVVIAFLKNSPKIDENGNFVGNYCENVSTIIMNIDSARNFADAIYELLEKE